MTCICTSIGIMVMIMQPNQNPYEFITSDSPGPKKTFFGGGDKKTKVIKVVIFGTVMLIILLLFYSLVFGNKKSTADYLYLPAAQQTDLIALTKIGSEKVRDGKSNLVMTTANSTLQSQNSKTLALIKKGGGGKDSTKTIKTYQDTKYVDVLQQAESVGKYEETFLALYANRLDAYKTSLKSAYVSTSGKTKDSLGEMYSQLDPISLNQEPTSTK